MGYLFGFFFLPSFVLPTVIYDFRKENDIKNWRIVNDAVLGGNSFGLFQLHPEGYGVFEGEVVHENDGGFTSVNYRFDKLKVKPYNKIAFRVKRSNTNFQIRVKECLRTHYSYVFEFPALNEWQEIEVSLKNMYPFFRGEKLEKPNFSHDQIESVSFFIGNNKPEKSHLFIDKIELH